MPMPWLTYGFSLDPDVLRRCGDGEAAYCSNLVRHSPAWQQVIPVNVGIDMLTGPERGGSLRHLSGPVYRLEPLVQTQKIGSRRPAFNADYRYNSPFFPGPSRALPPPSSPLD